MSFAYMPFYTGDYYRDTRHLSLLQHGAYRLLLDHCWDQRGPLPMEIEKCFRICGAVSKEEQDSVRSIVAEFFVAMPDGHYNTRMQQELERANLISGKRAGAAHARWKARESLKAIAAHNANAMQVHSNSIASATSPSPSPSQTEEIENLSTGSLVLSASRRAPACPVAEIVALYHEYLPTLPSVVALSPSRKRAIAARWREVCTQDGMDRNEGLEWFAWFFKHAARSGFLTGKVPGKSGRTWRADLDFLMTASKFPRVVEGAYHKETAE
jgi:uncharacterized protein YdaU (DUF1376 family)